MNGQDETMDMVIRDGIRFMESLTRHYGSERGQEIWEGIGEAVGKEVKGKIFFAMITGDILLDQVTFTAGNAEQQGNVVPVIKAIRTYSGWGLKEAKDQWDRSKSGRGVIQCETIDNARELTRCLRILGCNV